MIFIVITLWLMIFGLWWFLCRLTLLALLVGCVLDMHRLDCRIAAFWYDCFDVGLLV